MSNFYDDIGCIMGAGSGSDSVIRFYLLSNKNLCKLFVMFLLTICRLPLIYW